MNCFLGFFVEVYNNLVICKKKKKNSKVEKIVRWNIREG